MVPKGVQGLIELMVVVVVAEMASSQDVINFGSILCGFVETSLCFRAFVWVRPHLTNNYETSIWA